MDGLVLDASVTMTWCYADEDDPFAYRVLEALDEGEVIVPSLWAVRVANSIAIGERRKRLTPAHIAQFLKLLDGLTLKTDEQTASRAFMTTLDLARTHGLSAHDATYLELAIRENLLLATLDNKLRSAAKRDGVELFA